MIGRQIPLWGIICVLGGIAAQAVSVYYGQQSQAIALARLESTTASVLQKLDNVAVTQNASDREDLKRDFKLSDHENRLVALESLLRRQLPPERRQ